jgi:hypothetical protein
MNKGLLRGIAANVVTVPVVDRDVLNPRCAARPILDVDFGRKYGRFQSPIVVNVANATLDIDVTVPRHLYWFHSSAAWPAWLWSIPGGDFAMVVQMRQMQYSVFPANAFGSGLVLSTTATGGTGSQTMIGMHHLGNLGLGMMTSAMMSSTGFAGQTVGGVTAVSWSLEETFIGVRYIGGAWTCSFSPDGRLWSTWASFSANGGDGAQAYVGFGGGSSGNHVAVRSFRIWRSNVPRNGIGALRSIILPERE